jgi:hypothetical protein
LAVIQTINVLFDYVSVQDKIHYSSIVFDILYSDLNKKIWEGNVYNILFKSIKEWRISRDDTGEYSIIRIDTGVSSITLWLGKQ